jgi:anaerobic ribonucleoside-triphosphate reductase
MERKQKNFASQNYSELCEKKNSKLFTKQRTKCERYSRIVGYLRPLQQWNEGKQAEWEERKLFKLTKKNVN